ncbi:MAG: hypothetical protein HY720_07550 [Planctomycetes bacterium]|nr:hypothetical protein [Planctomycetota bacterium]
MPGALHELLVDLFRSCPRLVEELLPLAAAERPPEHDLVRTEDPDAVELSPVPRRADVVVLFEKGGRPVKVVVVEAQLGRDEEKRTSWPNYVTSLTAPDPGDGRRGSGDGKTKRQWWSGRAGGLMRPFRPSPVSPIARPTSWRLPSKPRRVWSTTEPSCMLMWCSRSCNPQHGRHSRQC